MSKDLSHIYYQYQGQRYQDLLRKQNKINFWRSFTENAEKFADEDCIWYSDPTTEPPTVHRYSWLEAHQWACRYTQWFLDTGSVKSGECVGFYLQNSPDFMFAWLGLLAIGCYPAMINYNLVGGTLVHCVKLAECPLLLVDEDFQDRVLGNEDLISSGVKLQVVDAGFKEALRMSKPSIPDGRYTRDANEKTRYALRYTRYYEVSNDCVSIDADEVQRNHRLPKSCDGNARADVLPHS